MFAYSLMEKDVNWESWTNQVEDKSESYADVLKGTVGSKTEVAVMTGNRNMRNGIQLSNVECRDEEIGISLDDVNTLVGVSDLSFCYADLCVVVELGKLRLNSGDLWLGRAIVVWGSELDVED
ncbi:hypothetical protein Droror1_Dr00023449 [Drosera rotundifolia]